MWEIPLQFLFFLPFGLLLGCAFLESFLLSRRDKDLEPAQLWLLFCAVCAATLAGAVGLTLFLWKGNQPALHNAFWSFGAAAAGTAAWFFKRQGRDRNLLLLREKFYDGNPANPPRFKPGQFFWILAYRGGLALAVLTAAGTIAAMSLRPGAAGMASLTAEAPEKDAIASSGPTPTATPSPTAGTPDRPVEIKPVILDPTRGEIPSAEVSEVAAMATNMAAGSSAPGAGATAPADSAPAVPVVTAPAAAARPVSKNSIYFSKIRPIIAKHCISCHGESKQKGDLALHTPDAIRAGINGKPAVIPGNSVKSRIFHVTGLPADDTDRMPPKGSPLSVSERELLAKWIDSGADLGDGVSIPMGAGGVFLVDSIAQSLPQPDAALIEKLKAEHVIVRPLSKNGSVVEIDFSHSDRAETDLKLAELAPIALNIYALDLTKTQVKDADLAALAPMKNLSRLLLSRTGITDAGLVNLKGNTSLENLNLYNTAVTDAGLTHLAELKSLKKVYLWQSQATDTGAKQLQEQVPGLVVSMGGM